MQSKSGNSSCRWTRGAPPPQQALDRLSDLLHSGYNSIVTVDIEDITDAERAHTFAAYGWEQGLLGDTTSALRIEALGNAAAIATVDPSVPTAGKYSATLMTRISNWLAILEAASLVANGGSRQVAIAERNVATGEMAAVNARVRHTYCGASDDG